MNILILTDTHLGIRSGNESVKRYQSKFFSDILFPFIKENKKHIDLILHMGDLFDQRQYISFKTLDFWYGNFIGPINDFNIPIDLIIGNHDCAYKETNSLNSPKLLLKEYKNFKIIEECCENDSNDFLYLPWINKENVEQSKKMIQNTKCKFVAGHLAIQGFMMMAGAVCDHSDLSMSDFLKFRKVFSGHFHWRSAQKNIEYLGSPYQLNWADVGNDKGFHLFDTDKEVLAFVNNPLEQYIKIEYNDCENTEDSEFDFSLFSDKFVKLVVKTKNNPAKYSKLVQTLYDSGIVQLQITDNTMLKNEEVENISVKTIPEIICSNIESRDIPTGIKSKLLEYMTELYQKTLC